MLLLSKNTIKQLCQEIDFYPKRSSGQSFLADEGILEDIIEASDLKPDDEILEIGPGFGFLTKKISERVKKVIAVELDKRLFEYLAKNLKEKNIEFINTDIFKVNLLRYFSDLNYKLISNLPYNITSLVLRNFLENPPRPKEMILTVQKEVAMRIISGPGRMSLLSFMVQFFSEPKKIREINKNYFFPEPEVTSVLLRIEKINEKKFKIDHHQLLKLVKVGFSAKRKKLTNNLKNGLKISPNISEKILKELGLNLNIRAQELEIKEWVDLAKKIFDISGKI